MSATGRPVSLGVDRELDEAGVEGVVRRLVPALGDFIGKQRWYGEKARVATAWSAVEVVPIGVGGDWYALTIVTADFGDGAEQARYFLPLAVVPQPSPSAVVLAHLKSSGGPWHVVDAVTVDAFARWWLDRVAAGAQLRSVGGTFRWQALPGLAERLPGARAGAVRVGSVEQSNSSIRFDEAVFLKVFRRLRAGINPDEEVGRFLTDRTPFRRLPVPLGTASYTAGDGTTYPLALVQSFVASARDGWDFTLGSLARALNGAEATPVGWGLARTGLASYAEAARLLGERTGDLHLALATDSDDPAFSPVLLSDVDACGWEAAVLATLRATVADLDARAPDLPPLLRRRITDLAAFVPRLERRAGGFRAQVGGVTMRVHGDYHLGQVLRTPDDDWVILDFEGEPARSIAERRAKTSPLKDVAGMLRSFGYARGAALRAAGDVGRGAEVDRFLRWWEAEARRAFLAGYRSVVGRRPGLVPEGAAFDAATAAWELDKALYEIAYELGNRPDWLDLPLDALLPGAAPGGTA